ncbi:MAG: DUF4093 domain-containing protein [Clostridia bacterium]|nr:DUF4093 domain-containing protein [Clostridia bacterium]
MFHTDRVIIVEGRYDKARLSALTDAMIVTTEGFRIFSDAEKQAFIKRLARERGLLILTDSDRAGFQIRAFIRKLASDADVINVYIPDVYGKEKRKASPSKEGKLGVEGIPNETLTDAIRRAGVFEERPGDPAREPITTADLYFAGLTGCENAADNRRRLLASLGLPARLAGASLLQTLNAFLTRESFLRVCEQEFVS